MRSCREAFADNLQCVVHISDIITHVVIRDFIFFYEHYIYDYILLEN